MAVDEKQVIKDLLSLIEDGVLVRNTDRDHNLMEFTGQALRLMKVIKQAKDVVGYD